MPAKKETAKMTQNSKIGNLVQISALDFWEGMHISTELYVKLADNYILLCSNSQLSKDLIAKINDFELTGDSLYIDADYYNQMGNHHKVEKITLLSSGVSKEYQGIRNGVADAFKVIGQDEHIPWAQTNQLSAQITEQLKNVETPFILQCISAIRSTDQYLYTHCVNVSLLNGLMARWMHKTPKESEVLVNIGLLHDIGKLRVPSSVLDKPGRLTRDEFAIMKKHSTYSEDLLKKSGVTDTVLLAAVRAHHEQMNGQGYPDALSADKIPEFARITAISDIYDAMVAKRVYKEPAPPFEVLAQFARDRFSHLDIHLVNIFLTQMSQELAGKKVKLSNGQSGVVLYIDKEFYNRPIVRVEGKIMRTSEDVYCTMFITD